MTSQGSQKPAGAAQAVEELPSLTSLRIFAASIVVLYHFKTNVALPAELLGPLEFGQTGVDLFFMLSGFILAYVYRRQFDARAFDHRRFLQKRLARIYPVHLVTMLIVAAWYLWEQAALGGVGPNPYDVLANVLLIHAWGTVDGVALNYPSWSISAEWFAYLAFPIPMLIAFRQKRVLVALGFALAAFCVAYWGLAQAGKPLLQQTSLLSLGRIAIEFFIGVTLFAAATAKPRQTLWVLAAAFVASLGACLTGFIDAGLPVVMAMPLIIFVLFRRPKLMAHPALVYGGHISYSLYMVHALVQIIGFKTVERLTDYPPGQLPAWWLIPAIIVTFVAAAALYHFVEEPGRRWISSLGARRVAGSRASVR